MTTQATDGKMLVNALYHSAVVSGLAAGYARLEKIAMGGSPPKLDFTPRDVGMVVVDVAVAIASGSNYLFSMLRSSDFNEERKRHDQAVEQLQARAGKMVSKTD